MRVVVLFVVASLLGCGPGEETAGPSATGVVTVDGKPAAYVSLMFYPIDDGSSASATTGSDGRFEIKTALSAAGIAPGVYKVVVAPSDEATDATPEIPEKYGDSETTDETITVTEDGPNEFKIELTSDSEA